MGRGSCSTSAWLGGGEVEILAGFSGEVARIIVFYEDPATGRRETRCFSYTVEPCPEPRRIR